jgi:SAM-dependent methyltransferase
MSYRQLTTGNSCSIKRYSHRSRYRMATSFVTPGRILDYGAGDAELLRMLASGGTAGAEFWGFEPFLAAEARANIGSTGNAGVRIVEAASELPTRYFDLVYCLEVLEHLPEELQEETIRKIGEVVRPGGRCVVSVPIEVGAASLVKNIIRAAVRQSHPGATPVSIIRSALGGRIRRPKADYIPSHVGFRYRDLERLFDRLSIRILREVCSPFPLLGKRLNSQVFYVLSFEEAEAPIR